jgi:hypothetical protein
MAAYLMGLPKREATTSASAETIRFLTQRGQTHTPPGCLAPDFIENQAAWNKMGAIKRFSKSVKRLSDQKARQNENQSGTNDSQQTQPALLPMKMLWFCNRPGL